MTSSSVRHSGLKYRKLSDEVAGLLQQMIMDGRLCAGQKVTQDELAKMLGVSTMPVREALLRLAALGIVDSAPNRSFRVARSSKDDVRDSYWMHASVASELTRRACLAEGPALAPKLQQCLSAYLAASEGDDTETLISEYDNFYRTINLAADSGRLLFILRTNLQFLPVRWFPRIEGWIPLSRVAHEKVIDAFEQGDADGAATAAGTHLREAGELLIRYYESIGRWAD